MPVKGVAKKNTSEDRIRCGKKVAPGKRVGKGGTGEGKQRWKNHLTKGVEKKNMFGATGCGGVGGRRKRKDAAPRPLKKKVGAV